MNANEISSKANPRLNRIRTVSRFVKYTTFAFLIFSVVMSFFMFLSLPSSFAKAGGWCALFFVLFQIVVCIWYWNLIRLFRCYERGLIFAAETIRCIKILGFLAVIGGMLNAVLRFLPKPPPVVFPPGTTHSASHIIRVGFFNFDFGTGFDFGLLLGGVVIVLIAWIMDEGRKIQEEQELTV
jgi:Protein of unknown function (DUF2975)